MKKRKQLFIALAFLGLSVGAALNAQTWQIGSPNAADVTATYSDGTLTISGTGATKDFTAGTVPWSYSNLGKSAYGLVIQPGITHIGNYTFYGVSGVTSDLIIPNTVTSIGASAFENCSNMWFPTIVKISIPKSVVSIGSCAFKNCGFAALDVDNANPSYASEDGILFNKGKTALISCPTLKTGDYVIPNTVTSIEDYAFSGSYYLSFVTISNSTTSIGTFAFSGCQFDYIKLPKTLTSLGGHAFENCNKLKTVEVGWDSPLTITSDVFTGLSLSQCTLIVPSGKTTLYKAADVWKDFGAIKDRVPVTGITLNRTSATITAIGATLQLTATIMPANATYQNFTWSSSNTNVATVSDNGLVTSIAAGTTVITVTTRDGGYSASCTVTVQYGDGAFTYINGPWISKNYSYKTTTGATSDFESSLGNGDILSCSDFSNGPFDISIRYQSKTEITKTIKVSLYVPKRAFTESFYPYAMQGPTYYDRYGGRYPTTNDLEKIKEFTIEAKCNSPVYGNWDPIAAAYAIESYAGNSDIPWDGMTDPAFTNGKSYPVQDNVWLRVTDAQTGAVLQDFNFQSYQRISRYSGRYAYTFTAKEHSVVCDIYFISQLPIKKAVPFIGVNCSWNYANPYRLKRGGIEKMVLSLLEFGSANRSNQEDLSAYQVFDNLSPDENGVYHISWEIKDLQGNFYDSQVPDVPEAWMIYPGIGLYVEGDRQETFNWGLPEYGGQFDGVGDYTPNWKNSWVERTPPRPLNPDATVNYPEFDIENGVLLHYHGNGGDVVIPNSVNKINDLAFYMQDKIKTLTIPAGVASIGDYVFAGCSNLTSITVSADNQNYCSDNGALYNKDKTVLIQCPDNKTGDFVIPNSVQTIGDYAFDDCAGLTSITIPSAVQTIGDGAFLSCSNLKSIRVNWATPLVFPHSNTIRLAINSWLVTLYVPAGTKALYQAADIWKEFGSIQEQGVAVSGITLNQSSAKLVVGDALQLTATVAPNNATYKDVGWSSSNSVVATVNADGKVTCIAPGTTEITATALYGNFKATCTVTVIDLNFTGFTLNGGDKIALFQTVNLDFGFDGGSPTHFMASENSNFNGALWKEYNPATLKYTFASSNQGTKTVYAKLKNGTGETESKNSEIFYKPYHPVTQATMYPSPVETLLNVELTADFTGGKVEIYSSTGVVLLSQKYKTSLFTLDLSTCPSGILFVKISDDKTNATIEKPIIKR